MQVEVKEYFETKNIDDASLLNQFPDLVEKYQHMVFSTCYNFLKNREDAEDVAQEVFVEIYRSREKFRGDSALSTWIYKISVNRSMDHIRKRNRKKRSLFAFKSVENEEMERLSNKEYSNPYQEIEEKEKRIIIESAINKLPERQRVAFTLAKVEGIKQDKVAEIMETTVGSVESLLIRAKKKLKELLKKQLQELID